MGGRGRGDGRGRLRGVGNEGGEGGSAGSSPEAWWSHGKTLCGGSWALETTGVGRPVCRLIK